MEVIGQIGSPMGEERAALRSFIAEKLKTAKPRKRCRDERLGKVVQTLGLDGLQQLRNLSAEEARQVQLKLSPEVQALFTGNALEEHLASCTACAYFTLDYLDFVEDSMWDVMRVACSRLHIVYEALEDAELDSESFYAIQVAEIAGAYVALTSTREMRESVAFGEKLRATPCSSRKIWRYVERHGVLGLATRLPLGDFVFKREGFRTRLSYEKRMELLGELSSHVATCPRCGMAAQREKEREEMLLQMGREPVSERW